jgi:DNA-directed RNA polymerase subunit E'/Rpb7
MTTECILQKNIDIPPCYLNDNIKEYIFNKINKVFCNQTIGYMLEVLEIINIESNPLCRGTNPSFNVTYKAKIFKPEPNILLDCKVKKIFSQGIIFEFGMMELLVPKDNKINVDTKEKTFIFNNKKYNIGDTLGLEILHIQYDKHNFSCIAKIQNKK